MIKEEKISLSELNLLIIGFVFGGLAVTSPAKAAYQNAWLAQILSWIGGFILVTIYLLIAKLNPKKTLIQMLKEHFGKYLGSMIGVLYIIFFIHFASLTMRIFGEYMVTVSFIETRTVFIICFVFLPITYALKNGIEIAARVNQLIIPMMIFIIVLTILLSAKSFKYDNFLPFLEGGFLHVLKIGLRILSVSFGNMIVFLMIYPIVQEKKYIVKTTYLGVTIVGVVLLGVLVRDLLVLGPYMMSLQMFPPHVTLSLIPGAVIEPIVGVNLLIGVGIKTVVFIYCALLGITQIFNLEDYKLILLPVVTLVISLSMWLHPNYPDLYRWVERNMVCYSLPFQVIIPCILLIISLIKNKTPSREEVS